VSLLRNPVKEAVDPSPHSINCRRVCCSNKIDNRMKENNESCEKTQNKASRARPATVLSSQREASFGFFLFAAAPHLRTATQTPRSSLSVCLSLCVFMCLSLCVLCDFPFFM